MSAPPLYFTKPPDEDIVAGDGLSVINFIETYCSLTNESFGGHAGSPMVMRPWQKSLIMCMYARNHMSYDEERRQGNYCFKRLLVGLARKNGKLLDMDTPILTANGWRTMGTLCEGDYVHAPDGSLTRVEWVSEIETKQAYKVCFKDGAQIVAGPEHEWLVNDRMRKTPRNNGPQEHPSCNGLVLKCSNCGGPLRGDSKAGICKRNAECKNLCNRARRNEYRKSNPCGSASRVVTTQELYETLQAGSRGDRRYTVDVPAPLDRPDADLPVDPYVLGAWLGDGSKASGQMTGVDEEIFSAFAKAGYPEGKRQKRPHNRAIGVTFLGLQTDLRNIGVLGNKHVPENYLLAPKKQRLELLRGLMDTDGCVNITGKYASAQCEFTNTNKNLADGVLFLARSLGWKASMREGRATLYGKDCGPKYRVFWTADRQMSPFRLWRKTKRLKESQGARSRTNAIISIEPIGERQLCCIEVAHPSHCYLADFSLTPTHNSSLAAPLALYRLFTSIDNGINGSRVVACASSKNQATGIVFNTAKEIVRLNSSLNSLIVPFRTVELRSADLDCSMRAIAAVAENQEGLNPDFIVYDELHTAPNPELYHTMAMSQGARPDAMMLSITTAGQKVDQTGEDSICYQQYQYGQKVCSGEIDDPSFFFAWWGAPEGSDYKDPAVWEMANPGWNDLNTPSLFRSNVSQLHESQFKTKHLNMWVNQFSSWLPNNAWNACESGDKFEDEGMGIVLGFDGSLNGDTTALVAMSVSENPILRVIGCWEKPPNSTAEWEVDRDEVKEAIRDACRRYDVREVACDEYLWISDLNELANEGLPIVKFPKSPMFMIPATQGFYEDVMACRIRHNIDPRMTRHLDNTLLKQTQRGPMLTKESKASSRKIDLAIAAVAANSRVHFYLGEGESGDSDVEGVW